MPRPTLLQWGSQHPIDTDAHPGRRQPPGEFSQTWSGGRSSAVNATLTSNKRLTISTRTTFRSCLTATHVLLRPSWSILRTPGSLPRRRCAFCTALNPPSFSPLFTDTCDTCTVPGASRRATDPDPWDNRLGLVLCRVLTRDSHATLALHCVCGPRLGRQVLHRTAVFHQKETRVFYHFSSRPIFRRLLLLSPGRRRTLRELYRPFRVALLSSQASRLERGIKNRPKTKQN